MLLKCENCAYMWKKLRIALNFHFRVVVLCGDLMEGTSNLN